MLECKYLISEKMVINGPICTPPGSQSALIFIQCSLQQKKAPSFTQQLNSTLTL